MSYDYGKSFQKISGKLNFGVGNDSDAVIAQFYHSPADNKRVRQQLSPVVTSWAVIGRMVVLRGAGRRSSWLSLQHDWQPGTVFLLTWELVTEYRVEPYRIKHARYCPGRISRQTIAGISTENLPTNKLLDL